MRERAEEHEREGATVAAEEERGDDGGQQREDDRVREAAMAERAAVRHVEREADRVEVGEDRSDRAGGDDGSRQRPASEERAEGEGGDGM